MTGTVLLATTVDWPSAARLAGALASLGARVDAVFPAGHALAVSRHLGRAARYRALAPRRSFAEAIADSAPELIVACDDRAVTTLLSLGRDDLKPLLERSFGTLASYPLLMARAEAMAAARAEGLKVADTAPIASPRDLDEAIYEFGVPLVLKTCGSWGGGGVAVARTQAEAYRAFRKFSRHPGRLRSLVRAGLRRDAHFLGEAWAPKPPRLVAQRYIAGKPATSAFVCRDGLVLAALHFDVVAANGTTGPAAILKRVENAQMDEACRRIAARFGLSGFIGLDFMRDSSGAVHLIEVNPRATQICHLALGPDLAASYLGLPPRAPVTDKPLVALFPQAKGFDVQGVLGEAYWDLPRDDPPVRERVAGQGWELAGGLDLNVRNPAKIPLRRAFRR